MDDILDIASGNFTLIVAPRRVARELLTDITARLALVGPIAVFDGGNCFDAYRVARLIRRHTGALAETLKRIQLARAFTCYQMLALLAQSPETACPKIVPGLLDTFDDEGIDVPEAYRLLQESIFHLRRLSRAAAVVVFSRPPDGHPERIVLLERLQETAGNVSVCQFQERNLQDRLL